MANPTTGTKDFGHGTADKLKETASHVMDKTKEAASNVGETLSNAASSAASAASKTAEKVTSATGAGVKHLGETIREKGPQDGVLGSATRAVSNTLEESGKYIEQEGLSGMMDDMTELIRRNPVPAVLVGIGIGFLIGRTLGS